MPLSLAVQRQFAFPEGNYTLEEKASLFRYEKYSWRGKVMSNGEIPDWSLENQNFFQGNQRVGLDGDSTKK